MGVRADVLYFGVESDGVVLGVEDCGVGVEELGVFVCVGVVFEEGGVDVLDGVVVV